MHASFIILADRGALRAAWIRPSLPGRPPHLEWVRDLSFVHPRQHWVEQVTDMAGAYSATESSGNRSAPGSQAPRRAPSSPSEIHWKLEADRKVLEDLAAEIVDLLAREKPERWSLAAPVDLHQQLVDRLPPAARERLSRLLPKNLVRASPKSVLAHFEVPQPTPPPDNQRSRELREPL